LDDRVPTDQERYDQLNDQVFALYREGRYADGLALIADHAVDLPEWRSDLSHTTACLHARSGDPDAALRVLADAADEGAWWHPRLLLEDDDLASLAPLDGFAELVDLSRRRFDQAQSAAARRSERSRTARGSCRSWRAGSRPAPGPPCCGRCREIRAPSPGSWPSLPPCGRSR
jgi:hypothetical protein